MTRCVNSCGTKISEIRLGLGSVNKVKTETKSLNPVSQLNIKFPGLQWDFQLMGPPHAPQCTATTVLQGNTFHGTGANKKEAKFLACVSALEA
ncbi:hypothetical protein EB796_018186 [Bugula neritina]|uniref:DRBM domain-containing protein n=1 Tax=Bugula neritina TaxID=10212 RepID=A0A7J7JCZ1_BUGNE|nr:hypothetical protein EB796_018186 [Bugula neritina]